MIEEYKENLAPHKYAIEKGKSCRALKRDFKNPQGSLN